MTSRRLIGIGCDVIAVIRMERLWRMYGSKLLLRVCHESETQEALLLASSGRSVAHFVASRCVRKQDIVLVVYYVQGFGE